RPPSIPRTHTTPPPPHRAPPSVSMTAPPGGSALSGAAVTVSATAADNIGVASVQFILDGTNLGPRLSSSPYTITWNTSAAVNGAHTLTAVARDAAGNAATAAAITVIVNNAPPPDTTPPSVSMTAPANAATVSGAAVPSSASAPALPGPAAVQFFLDGANLGPGLSSSPYTITWNTSAAVNGAHTLTAVARDAANNPATAAAITVIVN